MNETVLCDRCRRPLHTAVERWIGLCSSCEELRAEWSDDAADEISELAGVLCPAVGLRGRVGREKAVPQP